MNYTNITVRNSTKLINIFDGREPELLAWLIVTGSAGFLGAIFNGFALMAAWPNSTRISGFTLLICHFISLHLFMCLVNVTINVFMVMAQAQNRWMPTSLCAYVQNLWSATATLINWSDAGLAVNRCVALLFPHSYAKLSTKTGSFAIILVAWIVALVTRMIVIMSTGSTSSMILTQIGYCVYLPGSSSSLSAMSSYLTIFTPYAITGLGAVIIFLRSAWIMNKSSLIRKGRDEGSLALRRRLKMARMLLLTYLGTAVCASPGYVIVYCFPDAIRNLTVSGLWIRAITPFQYGVMPCILLLSNGDYRKKLIQVLFRKQRETHPPSIAQSTSEKLPRLQLHTADSASKN